MFSKEMVTVYNFYFSIAFLTSLFLDGGLKMFWYSSGILVLAWVFSLIWERKNG